MNTFLWWMLQNSLQSVILAKGVATSYRRLQTPFSLFWKCKIMYLQLYANWRPFHLLPDMFTLIQFLSGGAKTHDTSVWSVWLRSHANIQRNSKYTEHVFREFSGFLIMCLPRLSFFPVCVHVCVFTYVHHFQERNFLLRALGQQEVSLCCWEIKTDWIKDCCAEKKKKIHWQQCQDCLHSNGLLDGWSRQLNLRPASVKHSYLDSQAVFVSRRI